MKLLYKFSIDTFSHTFISGWCFARLGKKEPIRLEFRKGRTVLGECVADIEREDLRDQGVHPDGKCGFSFFLPPDIAWHGEEPIDITVKNSQTRLVSLDKTQRGREIFHTAPLKERVRVLFGQKKELQVPAFFMHIPKTAGTSFNTFVRSHFSGAILTHLESYDQGEYRRIAEEYQYIAGHLPVAVAREYFSLDHFQWYTLLREPYSHLHSHINWLRGIGAQSEERFFHQHHSVFQDIARSMAGGSNLNYQQLQFFVDSVSGILGKILQNCQTRYFLAKPGSQVGLQDVPEALDTLEHFHCVGLTEHLADFKKAFLHRQAATFAVSDKRLNRAKFHALYDHRDPVTQEIVRPLVEADLVVYQTVQAPGAGGRFVRLQE